MLSSNGADEAALEISYTDAPAIDVATAKTLLLEVKKILDDSDVPFFLRQGTCLGAIRDNALITWDDDIDVGSIYGRANLTEEKIEAVATRFRENGFFAKIEPSDQYISVTLMKSSTRIDWNCYKIIDDIVFHYPGVRIPARVFSNLKEIDFIGDKFFVPNPPEDYLRFKYGKDWKTPKKVGFEKDVLALISDAPANHISRFKAFLNRYQLRRGAGKLRVLGHNGEPIVDAQVRIAALGNYRTDKQGYAKFHIPKDDWYALIIKYDAHEEVLYQEKLAPGATYIYRPSSSTDSGRICILSSE